MQVDTVLTNAKVHTKNGWVSGGIAIDDIKIVKIGKSASLPKAVRKVDLNGNLALPGLVDLHVHLRDEQISYREDFHSGTAAAAAGGVTTAVDMPNNRPLTMSAERVKERMQLAESRILVNLGFNSAFPVGTAEIHQIVRAGAVGFKLYLLQQLGGVNIDDDDALLQAFKLICDAKAPIFVHAEDKTIIETAKQKLAQRGREDVEAFLMAHPPEAEEKAILRVAALSKKSGAQVHVCHVSSAMGLQAVLDAKKAGYNLTCEVTPHHLLLTSAQLKHLGSLALELPPLRQRKDLTFLWRGVREGWVDTIGSDHAPHSFEEKHAESVWDVKPGIVGLETMLPLMLTQVNKGRVSLERLVQLACEKPSELLGLRDRGSLTEGLVADLTVVDMKKEYKIDASKFYSKAKFSPFDGWNVKGKVMKTWVNGQLIMDDGEIVGKPGTGRIMK